MTKYIGQADYKHNNRPCLGVLLTNLGTPDAPTVSAVRKYLAEFLSDPRVIEVPKPVWWLILYLFILPFRPRRSAHAYNKIWTKEGSPLLILATKQMQAIQNELAARIQGPVKVQLAMRYGNPSIKSGLKILREEGAERILILPLYPQYSATTTASTFDAITNVLQSWRWIPEVRMINHYHDNPGYIEALAESISAHWQQFGQAEKLLFSFHGIPEHYFMAGDPYHCECHKTARLVAEKLQLEKDKYMVTFQSRFGPREWLKPYTDETLKKLARDGIQNVNVICPGFSVDCLETLEEINIQYRALFIACGGDQFTYIPALNDQPRHIEALTNIIINHCQGWPELSTEWNISGYEAEIKKRNELFQQLQGTKESNS